MIQRVQSIFLLLAAAACLLLFNFEFASVSEGVGESVLFADNVYEAKDNTILLVMYILAGVLALVNIFLYSNRKRQLSVNRILIILNLLGIGLAIFLFVQDMDKLASDNVEDGIGLYLPLVAFVFIILASRFIKKDENLVRSMDRLR